MMRASDGGKGSGRRPDPDDNFRKNRDLIDWSAKGEKPKPKPNDEAPPPEPEET